MPVGSEIIGMGVDLISWSRAERFLRDHSNELLQRLLTPSEQRVFQKAESPLHFFVRCFTAKEAYFKACGDPWMGESGFREIETRMEGNDQFRIQSPYPTAGRFFETPNGMGAQVVVYPRKIG